MNIKFLKDNDIEIFGINLATSFRNSENPDLPTNSSLGQKMSNVVGQLKLKPNSIIDISYDFLTDNNLDQMNYHKINSTFKVNNFVSSFEFIEENNDIGSDSFIANETSYKLVTPNFLNFVLERIKKLT